MSCCIPGWKKEEVFRSYMCCTFITVQKIACLNPHSPQCIQQSLHAVWRLLFQHLDAALHLHNTHMHAKKYSFKRKVIPFCPSPLTVIMDTHPHTPKKPCEQSQTPIVLSQIDICAPQYVEILGRINKLSHFHKLKARTSSKNIKIKVVHLSAILQVL